MREPVTIFPNLSGAEKVGVKLAFLILLSICFLLIPFSARTADTGVIESIILKNEKLPFVPAGFYVAEVLDAREDKGAVAWLLPTGASESSPALAVDLKGGALPAIRTFITQGMPANKSLRPLRIRLQQCRITEQEGSPGVVEGRVVLKLSYALLRGEEEVPLGAYSGGVRYKRSVGHYGVVEPALRRTLVSALTYVNEWMEREAAGNVKLAKGVKVQFIDYQSEAEDTVFYSPHRPLQWEDFKAKPRSGRYGASIFPSFSYKGDSKMVDGYIQLQLQLKVYTLQHSSWVKKGSKDAYSLNHEQKHFDIVKLVAERFKQKVREMPLEVADYGGRIGYQYLEFFREMNRLQEAYDTETAHGLNKAEQERWNRKIEEELAAFSLQE